MSPPRYRTLDGEEVELPLAMDRSVLVPRGLARFDPELLSTLDYEDAPEPEAADPRLDFSDGALLVPVDRWNERAELEPNLAACRPEHSDTASRHVATARRTRAVPAPSGTGPAGPTVGVGAARCAAFLVAALAASY